MTNQSHFVSLEEAIDAIINHRPTLGRECLPLDQCAGRILSESLTSPVSVPPFDASAMDGYAVRFDDVRQTGRLLSVIDEVPAGSISQVSLGSGQAVRVFTGSPLPEGADHVLIEEHARQSSGQIEVLKDQPKARHVRKAGGDFASGDIVLKSGALLRPAHIGAAAAANSVKLNVFRRLSVAVFGIGSELRSVGSDLQPGQIADSNSWAISALFSELGADVMRLAIATDDTTSIEDRFRQAASADLILTVGGASIGKHDLVRDVFLHQGGQYIFERVAIRPGKPTWFGTLGKSCVLGLPGNPTAAFIMASLLGPILMSSANELKPVRAHFNGTLAKNGERETLLRAYYVMGDGTIRVSLLSDQDTSRTKALTKANCLIVRAPSLPAQDNGVVSILLLT
ncbi:MAG: gephyrin-like molybdotransferase Glp [Pseudomonadota bacterium]